MVAEKDRKLFQFLASVETTNIVLSFVANIFLIVVIVKSSKELANYRFLLLAFAINDIWFPFVHILTLPVICSYRDAFIMFSNGILTSKFSICLFAAVFSQTMPIMAHLFIYRLIVLRWPQFSRFYSGRRTSIVISFTVLLQLTLWFSNCWFNYHSDDELQSYVKPFLDSEFPGAGTGHIGALYYNKEGLRLSAVLTTMGFNSIMMFWFTIIAVCTVLIVNSFKVPIGTHAYRTQHLQKQMFKTLILQMLVPIVCVYFPCAGIINCPMIFQISVFPNFVSAALTLFPLVDSIITLIGVRVFRRHIVSIFHTLLICRSDAGQLNLASTTIVRQ